MKELSGLLIKEESKVFRLTFLGTRAEIEEKTENHFTVIYSEAILAYDGMKMMV